MRTLFGLLVVMPLLAACGGAGMASSGGGLGSSFVLEGQIADWDGSTGKLELLAPVTPGVVASGAVGNDGRFRLEVPDLAGRGALPPMKDQFVCPSGSDTLGADLNLMPSATTGMARSALRTASVQPGGTSHLRLQSAPGVSPALEATYLYFAADGAVRGTVRCLGPDGERTLRYDLAVQRGWNVVVWREQGSDLEVYAAQALPQGLLWRPVHGDH
ncbi:hypothetical protein HNR42_000988 [Deinobacterium chartae]|uniref:Carboxypeptidase regulatory-like domain-containing protein n=1 Tax=Deinobacterium chartae TaxID=521158 RepID=A0A841HVN4_9DEIO|nr:hypothetical protein [Deinobacterium chartae]MBB6097571.1 hypothetical protein [Deinobacterium chartae]